jgi:integrase
LELQDIDIEQELIHIRPNSIRRLKTKNSERTLPLVGYAKTAMEQALNDSDEKFLFPRYVKAGNCKADHASAALGKWLKKDFDSLTAHCLRHTFRDRLRAVECPLELLDQIGGWSTMQTIGSIYGKGYEIKSIREYILKVSILAFS